MTLKRFKTDKDLLKNIGRYTIDYHLVSDQRPYFISNKLYGSYDYENIIFILNGVSAMYKTNTTIQVIDPKYIQYISEMINEREII